MEIAVLVVDDQEDIRLLMEMLITAANEGLFVSGSAANASEAIKHIAIEQPSVVVLDQMMPDTTGVELAEMIRKRIPGQRMVMCSAYLDPDLRRRAAAAGITVCLAKEDVDRLPDILREVAAAR